MVKKIKIWKKTVNGKYSKVWEKVDKGSKGSPMIAKKFIKLNRQSDYIRETFKNSNWEVMADKRINKETKFGKVKNFRTKEEALKFIKNYIKNN